MKEQQLQALCIEVSRNLIIFPFQTGIHLSQVLLLDN